jgi:hypothetical protein
MIGNTSNPLARGSGVLKASLFKSSEYITGIECVQGVRECVGRRIDGGGGGGEGGGGGGGNLVHKAPKAAGNAKL